MKKLIMAMLMACSCAIVIAQTSKHTHKLYIQTKPKIPTIDSNKFMGIGIFKLGSDSSVLINYAQNNVYFIRDIDSFESYNYYVLTHGNNGKDGMLRLKKNKYPKYNLDFLGVSTHPDLDVYFLYNYEVSGITIRNIKLKYFKGKLIDFNSDYESDVIDAINQKYGEGKVENISKEYTCLYNITGITRKLEGYNIMNSWENGPIFCMGSFQKGFDDHCKETFHGFFTYSIKNEELDKWEDSQRNIVQSPKNDLKNF